MKGRALELPVRIVEEAPTEPVIAVDGAVGAPGLELSHWPGNRTPRELRHPLSTGIALAFARLPSGRRAALAAGATAIVNNHYDTDGTLALFAVRHPERALPHADRLLAAAEAGDFFRFPSDEALALDATISGLVDPERSPWRAELAGLPDRARHEHATHALLELLPALLEGGLDGVLGDLASLWRPTLDAARADRTDLVSARRDDVVHLDLTVWTAGRGAPSTRSGAGTHFDPGRHAFFGSSDADRVLVIGPGAGGATYRLVVSTLSWFDLDGPPRLPRPDLGALAARLNEREGTESEDELAWRAQRSDGPSPELWFGALEHQAFAEHAPGLARSALAPEVVLRELADLLREPLLRASVR